MNDLTKNDGLVRTDMYCHNCETLKLPPNFIARIDFGLDGNHEVECPRCGHLHYRQIVAGRVTGERYNSDVATHQVRGRNVWKATTQPIYTSSAQAFLRDRWLNRGD